MALRELDYQGRVLARLDDYLTELVAQKAKADKIEAANAGETDPDLLREVPDCAEKSWEALRAGGKLPVSRQQVPFSPRFDGIGRPVPNIVYKVPTGGGKTFLAVASLSKIFGRFLGRNRGFVLWIVPNEAIYAQTKRQLTDRQHPYRQMLDVLSGNAVRLLEKESRLDARDVESHLCVMLLMLQASNRQNRDSLRMFRDRGDVHGFFPPEGDQVAHAMALERTPNLDSYDLGEAAYPWHQVKDSLGNALRIVRPVVVMDEGHKAVSELAFRTLYGFNPCFVLELTATPKDVRATGGREPRPARYANVLVDVQGIDLDREGMIKMPLNLDPRSDSDWHTTLAAALGRLRELDTAARTLQSDTGRHIRPILLVQVERTGKEQRDGSHIHALDVRDWLTSTGGLDEAEIAVKTAETNELADEENRDLLSPLNRVRVIITKQALQEGWDCPFAYVLCTLSASSSLSSLTQLVGRILRQPQAEKTGVALLDESYVITHHADTAKVVEAIKKGLEEDGMGDLVREIRSVDPSLPSGPHIVQRRPKFAMTQIFLPLVLKVDDSGVRPLRYEHDILMALDWQELDVSSLVDEIPDNFSTPEQQMQRFSLAENGRERIVAEVSGRSQEALAFDPAYAVRMISDIVPNAWWAREIVGRLAAGLASRGFDEAKLGSFSGLLVERLRLWLEGRRDEKAEALFRSEVSEGRIQFRLRADSWNWKLPDTAETSEPEEGEQLPGRNGEALQKSLFSPVFKNDMNRDERDVAVYLDAKTTLTWWHRNVARSHYALQGWRRQKIYPDFICAVRPNDQGNRLVVLEMKGDHLAGNGDTDYKQKVLRLMTSAFDDHSLQHIGELELVSGSRTSMQCDLVLFSEWETKLPGVLG